MNKRGLPFLIMALLVLTAGVLLLTGRFGGQTQAQEPGGIIQPDVLVALQESSEVLVFISLTALALPPPEQFDPATLDELRRQVAAVQDRILAKLTPVDFTLTIRYSVTTALAGRITKSGVEILRGHPDVELVVLNREVFVDPIEAITIPSGDANCDGDVSSTDAVLVLLLEAALIQSLPCEGRADVYVDGETDSRDAAVILQIVAGLCCVQAPTVIPVEETPTGLLIPMPIDPAPSEYLRLAPGDAGFKEFPAEFSDFALYWVGEEFGGHALRYIIRHVFSPGDGSPTQNSVTFLYGSCVIEPNEDGMIDGGCPPPLQIIIAPYCLVPPELIGNGTKPPDMVTVRGGADAVTSRGAIRIWTGDVTIKIYASSSQLLEDATAAMVSPNGLGATSADSPLPAPDPDCSGYKMVPHPAG